VQIRRCAAIAALLLLLAGCGGSEKSNPAPGVLVIVLDPTRPEALAGSSLPFEVTVRNNIGELVGNYSLSHANDPLVLLVQPGKYRVAVSDGCHGRVTVPPRGSPTHGNEAHVLVSIYDRGRCKVR
jgi:hypothetical protein